MAPEQAGPTIVPDIPSLEDYVGKPLGTTSWVALPQQQIDAFAEATGDHQWIHVDVERAARESPFGGTIAHGYLTLALVPRLLSQLLRVERTSRVVNYGIDKMRLPAAVPAGARVRLSAQIEGVRNLPNGGARVVTALELSVEGSRKPAMTARAVYVYFP
jgi:acyl dehydratase